MYQIIRQHRIYRQDLRANPNLIYVFGDNVERVGLGGQAKEMRGEPNAHGIATLWAPGRPFDAIDVDEAKKIIIQDFVKLENRPGTTIVWPSDGIGTGLANMPEGLKVWLDMYIKNYFKIRNVLPNE